MATTVCGTEDASTHEQETVNTVKNWFAPRWIQLLNSGKLLFGFKNEDDASIEFINYMYDCGYTLEKIEDSCWTHYVFKK